MEHQVRREWLKALRKEKNLTVRALAPLLDISWSHYSDIENGRRNPSVELSIRMAKFFDKNVMEFLENRVKHPKKDIS